MDMTQKKTSSMKRLARQRLYYLKRKLNETTTQRNDRLKKNNESKRKRRKEETTDEYENRLINMRKYYRRKCESETEKRHEIRLSQARKTHNLKLNRETDKQRESRLQRIRQNQIDRLTNESDLQRKLRLAQLRANLKKKLDHENVEEHNYRLSQLKNNQFFRLSNESKEQRKQRLANLRINCTKKRNNFDKEINVFANTICEGCKKRCYPIQWTFFESIKCKNYMNILPIELKEKSLLKLCHRCKNHLKSSKANHPPKAYWNNLDPGVIPEEIESLTPVEKRLLSRIVPFLKIIKFEGRFGQHGFKGQSILFAQDIFEVREQLPKELPRTIDDSEMILIVESLEDINLVREFEINKQRIEYALKWLIKNNPLYSDVDNVVHDRHYDLQNITREFSMLELELNEENNWFEINVNVRILRASWNQANEGKER